MIAWLLVIVFCSVTVEGTSRALWQWRTATSLRDVRYAVMQAAGAVGAMIIAWRVGSW